HYNGSEEEEALLTSFDPSCHTLICTNLRIKKQIQNLKIPEHGWMSGRSVQRAREFWQGLYQDLIPADSPLGNEFASVLFAAFMKERPELKEIWPRWQGLE